MLGIAMLVLHEAAHKEVVEETDGKDHPARRGRLTSFDIMKAS